MVQHNFQNKNLHFTVNSREKPNNTVQFRKSYLTYLKYLRNALAGHFHVIFIASLKALSPNSCALIAAVNQVLISCSYTADKCCF